jgi:hypothetical protein
MDDPGLDWRPVGIDVDGAAMSWTEVSPATLKAALEVRKSSLTES